METARPLPRFFVAWSALPWVLGQAILAAALYEGFIGTAGEDNAVSVLRGFAVFGYLVVGVLASALVTGVAQAVVLRRCGIRVPVGAWTFATFAGILSGYLAASFAGFPALLLLDAVAGPAREALRSDTTELVLAIVTVGAIAFLGVVCLGFAFGAVLGAVQGGVLRDAGVRDTETWWWRMGLVWTAATLALVATPVLVLVVSVIGLALLPGQVAGLLTGVAMRRMIQPHGPPSTVEAAPALPEPALVAAGAADAEAEVREV